MRNVENFQRLRTLLRKNLKCCMLKIENGGKKIYLRYGVNQNNGVNLHEMILIDEYGNVDPSTPIQYDYDAVTSITRFSVTDKPISVGNGKITTIAPNPKEYDPDYENNYCYFNRGIAVKRSNTTIYGIEHCIVADGYRTEKVQIFNAEVTADQIDFYPRYPA